MGKVKVYTSDEVDDVIGFIRWHLHSCPERLFMVRWTVYQATRLDLLKFLFGEFVSRLDALCINVSEVSFGVDSISVAGKIVL